MNKVKEVRNGAGNLVGYIVKSPATGACICFYTTGNVKWEFNGDTENPTFSPSMLVFANHNHPKDHFFVRNGKIEYLPDCEHSMAGQTVDMIDCGSINTEYI